MKEAGLVVVGAALAGLRAVESARRTGYDGPITLVGAEPHMPYDRPPLSKAYLKSPDAATPTYPSVPKLEELGVDVRLGCPATGVCLDEREIATGDGTIPFDTLVVATGSAPISLPGTENVDGVHTLRTVDDARAIRRHVRDGTRAVLVGGGFIGAEIASALRAVGAQVTIVEATEVPLVRAVGADLAPALAELHGRAGVDLRTGVSVDGVTRADDGLRVTLSDGVELTADLVLAGIGARPATEWLSESGLRVGDGLVCDETLCSAPGIYAAGDVARWPNGLFDTTMRLENWTAASEQGMAAGRNAAKPADATPFETVPYFWSDWYGDRIQMVGVTGSDEVLLTGNDESWVALYRREKRIVGALTLNQPRKIMKYRRMISRRSAWDDAVAFAREVAAA